MVTGASNPIAKLELGGRLAALFDCMPRTPSDSTGRAALLGGWLRLVPILAGLGLAAGCGESNDKERRDKAVPLVGAVPARSPMVAEPPKPARAKPPKPVETKPVKAAPVKRLYSKWVKSLELRRSISVRLEPKEDSKKLGTVAAHTRVMWKGATRNRDCPTRWIEIEPRGWICERYLKPSRRRAFAKEQPQLERGEIVPGTYGKVVVRGDDSKEVKAKTFKLEDDKLVEARELDGSVTVRKRGEKTIEEKPYWDIGGKEYLPVENLREHKPSEWRGVRLGDDTGLELPIGFVMNRKNYGYRVVVYKTAKLDRPVRRLPPRAVVRVLERVEDDKGRSRAYRIGDDQWVAAREIHVARKVAPPPLTGAAERWVDVDLSEQVLVAYEGATPVYATLVSTGVRKHETQPGIFRIWLKFSETDMSGQMDGEAPYSVATVPWTQYYAKDFALHTAYWHDVFGLLKSHGCVNLAPRDSRFLYFWSDPQVPAGWTMANGILEHPGSMVRVHSNKDPDPQFVGYAKQVYEARKAAATRTR